VRNLELDVPSPLIPIEAEQRTVEGLLDTV